MMQDRREQISTVSEVNRYIKNMFVREYALNRVCVQGEISNCKYHSSGHIYFTLKDKNSALACVMFSSCRRGLDFQMREGMSVIVQGSVQVYERDGRYQLYATRITREGTGRLYEEYEKLKKRLLAEGLFDEDRKKPVPQYASRIGVVTAQTGAVIQDICNVSHRRNPYVQIILYPARVQGENAAQTVIRGLRYFETTDVDTVIIGRGGGSIEDLWAFNDEELARTIASCTKPVISAVGHETDTTIADWVADLRAPTPSAAAELAVYDWWDLQQRLADIQQTLDLQMQQKLHRCRLTLSRYQTAVQGQNPRMLLRQQRMRLDNIAKHMTMMMEQRMTSARHQLALYVEEMKGLSPLYKLQGGFGYARDEQGVPVRSVSQIRPDQMFRLTLQDGDILAQVREIRPAGDGTDVDTDTTCRKGENYGKEKELGRLF